MDINTSHRVKRRVLKVAHLAGLFIAMMIICLPGFWIVLSSLRPTVEIMAKPPVWIPQEISLDAYRAMFEQLCETQGERTACRLTVELLSIAHERACEAELARLLEEDLAKRRMPDMAALRARFAPDPASLPEVVVQLAPLSAYDALIEQGEAA